MNERALVSFDYAIKYLLKNKGDYDIVEGFISTLIGSCGYKPVRIKALLESASNKEGPSLKGSIADLVVEDEDGVKYIVEIDRSYTNLFMHKACFNSSRLIVDSISSGEDYSTIKKIIHINLLYFPFGGMAVPMHHARTIFHEIDTAHPQNLHLSDMGMQFFDAYNIFPEYFIISVPLFNDVIKNEMDEWLYMMKHSEVKEAFKSPYMKKVAQRLSILKMTKTEREIYQAYRNESLKERDYIVSAEEKGREEGREEGREIGEAKGRAEGRIEGRIEGSIEIAKNLLSQNIEINIISNATGLSAEEIEKLTH
jgi:predicted transposase/invertase (TIGR01784 family)